MLALLLIGALADAPLQARLLTPDEIAEAPLTELSVPQLELERARIAEPRVVWPAYTALGFGIAASLAGTITGGLAIGLYSNASGFFDFLIAGAVTVIALGVGVPGVALGIAGGVVARVLHGRRERYAARHSDVVNRLEGIRAGAVRAPLPESSKHAAELIRLADERPGLVLPLVVAGVGGGLLGSGGSVLGMLRTNPRASSTELGVAIAATCAGVLLFGIGLYRAVRVAQERSEIDARIAELKALPPPVAADDYWHF